MENIEEIGSVVNASNESTIGDIFIILEKSMKKVVKFPKRFNADKKKEFTLKNKDIILKIISDMKEVVRTNHFSKKSFKILKLPGQTQRLEIELFHATDFILSQKYRTRYNKRYDGWIIEEVPYIEDKSLKSMREMQEEYLKNNTVERTESEINFLNKDLKIYKSKSYINDKMDYHKVLEDIVHIYDNLRYMKHDGSIDIVFTFKRNVFNSGRSAFQTIYWMTQTNNDNLKTKRLSINELNIPALIEEQGLVPYNHSIAQKYYAEIQERKYRLSQKRKEPKKTQVVVNGNKFVVDDEEWSEDWFSNLTGFQG